ncbi:trafficking protein particle complex subunit 10, partial [Thraustotheca clavata]
RALTGWDFSSFLQIKESLALLYIQASLHDEALRHYDELEATFTTISDAQQDALQELPELDAMDSIFSTTPFDINMTTIRMNIAVNAASPLYIRLYLFCRQVAILHTMHKHESVAKRSLVFLPQFMQLLQQLEIPPALPLQWAIGAALAVFVSCEDELQQFKSTNPTPEPGSLSLVLADLLYLARRVWRKLPPIATRNPSKHWYFACLELESLHEITYWASVNYANAGRHRMAAYLGSQCAQYSKTPSNLLLKQVEQVELDQWWDLFEVATLALYQAYIADGQFDNAANLCLHWLQLEPLMLRISPKNLNIHQLWIDSLKQCSTLDSHWNSNVIEVLSTSKVTMPNVFLRIKNCLLGSLHLDRLQLSFKRLDGVADLATISQDNGKTLHPSDITPALVVVQREDIHLAGSTLSDIPFTIQPNLFTPGDYYCQSLLCQMANQSFHIDLHDEKMMQFHEIPQYQSTLTMNLMPSLKIFPARTKTCWTIHIDPSEDIVLDGKLTLETSNALEFVASNTLLLQGGVSKVLTCQTFEPRKLIVELPRLSEPVDVMVHISTNDPGSAIVESTLSYSYTRSSEEFVYPSTKQVSQTLHVGSMLLFNEDEIICKSIEDKLFIQVPLRCNALLPITLEPSSSELWFDSINLFQAQHSSVQVLFNPMSAIESTNLQINGAFNASFSLCIKWASISTAHQLTYRVFYSMNDSSQESMDVPISINAPILPTLPQWTLQLKSLTNQIVYLGSTVRFQLELIPTQNNEEAPIWITLHPKCTSDWISHGKASYLLSSPYNTTIVLLPLRYGVCKYPHFDIRMGHKDGQTIHISESSHQLIVM